MSSDEQAGSIEQQRRECRAYAARMGWVIVAEYVDEGKSGSKDVEKRVEFHRMIADSYRGDWKAVLVWHSNRFSRQDPLDAAEYKKILRNNGVHLETVTDGRTDWAIAQDRMLDSMKAEQNHAYSVDLGKVSIRGRMEVIRQGFWPHGMVPYGYQRQYWFNGQPVGGVTPRGQKAARARGWRMKLVIDDALAPHVRWMFEQFASRDLSLTRLAVEMAERGAPPPRPESGKSWTYDNVRWILEHPAYAGDTPLGQNRCYGDQEAFTRCEPTVTRDTHPAIVERATWERVQAKLRKAAEGRLRVHWTKASPLSGILYCGHCGYRMTRGGCNGTSRFICQSPHKRPNLKCKGRTAREDVLLREICQRLAGAIDFEVLDKLRAGPPKQDATELHALRKRVASLEAKVKRGADNLLFAEPGVYGLMRDRLDEWRAELDKAGNTLRLAETGASGQAWKAALKWYEQARDTLVTISESEWLPVDTAEVAEPIGSDDRVCAGVCLPGRKTKRLRPAVQVQADVLRDLLHRLNAHVYLHWKPKGDRYSVLDFGRLRADFDKTGLVFDAWSP